MTDDKSSHTLIVYMTFIEIVDVFIDFALFNSYCVSDILKIWWLFELADLPHML